MIASTMRKCNGPRSCLWARSKAPSASNAAYAEDRRPRQRRAVRYNSLFYQNTFFGPDKERVPNLGMA